VRSVCKVSKTPMSSITYYAKGHCRTCISKSTLRRTVHDAAKRYAVSDILITSVIAQESSFKPDARLGTQVGLMQVDLGWHRKKFHGDPYRPSVNVMVGTSILRDCLIRKHHDTRKALRCYNGGGDPHYAHKVLTATYQVKALL
jgi:soluble lytic murein transglycosylase-like protein